MVQHNNRWDVVLQVLNGPLSNQGEQVIRGPIVRIGGNPGADGFRLSGYRGLDARQCVITAYDGGKASIAPVGTNQVRMAPHANVKWKDIDPISGPEFLSQGCALHLGPIGRGATIEFKECRKLGVWEGGALQSNLAEQAAPREAGQGPVPASYQVDNVATSTAPFWFMGCTFLMGSSATTLMLSVFLAVVVFNREVAELGPVEDGYEFYESIDPKKVPKKEREKLFDGLNQAYYDFVMAPNIDAATTSTVGWEDPKNWDQRFYEHTIASANMHRHAWSFFKRLDAVRTEYSKVTLMLREQDLPEVFAAVPYQESRYRAEAKSPVCAQGYWQFMPEVAYRVGVKTDIDFRVGQCQFVGSGSQRWTPNELAPPPRVRQRGAYMREGNCVIKKCDIDDRTNLEKSTEAALYTLGEAWNDPEFRNSGSAVQMTITSHNAGYDDGRFGKRYRKTSNVLPAYLNWIKANGRDQGRNFTGDNIRCATHNGQGSYCGAHYPPEAQHYTYTVVALHMLAVCYYARNYGEDPAFNDWVQYLGPEGYCKVFKIPSKEEVRSRKIK